MRNDFSGACDRATGATKPKSDRRSKRRPEEHSSS